MAPELRLKAKHLWTSEDISWGDLRFDTDIKRHLGKLSLFIGQQVSVAIAPTTPSRNSDYFSSLQSQHLLALLPT